MTENTPTPADHIAELYALARDIDEGESVYYGADDWRKTARDLRDASNAWESDRERLTAERDALAAVIEQAPHAEFCDPDEPVYPCTCFKSTVPATVLAQRDAQVLRAEADRLEALIPPAGLGGRQSGYGQAGLDLLSQVRREADRIEREAQR